MQAVILAAGEGMRLRPLTLDTPKPLIRIDGKALVEHTLGNLPDEIDGIIFVVGYLSERIRGHFGGRAAGRPVRYVMQKEMNGTGGALALCRDFLRGRFLAMMGDNIYSRNDIKKCLAHERCILVREMAGGIAGGLVVRDERGNLKAVVEGKHGAGENLVNTGLYVLDDKFFDYDLVPLSGKSEFGLPQTLVNMSKDWPVAIEKADFWLQINDLDELKEAERILTKK